MERQGQENRFGKKLWIHFAGETDSPVILLRKEGKSAFCAQVT
jgi:hypothetical protein